MGSVNKTASANTKHVAVLVRNTVKFVPLDSFAEPRSPHPHQLQLGVLGAWQWARDSIWFWEIIQQRIDFDWFGEEFFIFFFKSLKVALTLGKPNRSTQKQKHCGTILSKRETQDSAATKHIHVDGHVRVQLCVLQRESKKVRLLS